MRNIIITLFVLNSVSLLSQNIEIIGGVNQNAFYDFAEYNASYTPEYGYSMWIGVDNIKADWLNLRFALGFDQYGGELEASDFNISSSSTTKASVDKSVLTLGVFPLNHTFFNRVDLNLGFELGALINETYEGTISGYTPYSNFDNDLNDEYNQYSAKFYVGLRGRIAYDIKLTDKWVVSPQYSYYFGLTKEFDDFPDETKSMRNYFCIGLQRNF